MPRVHIRVYIYTYMHTHMYIPQVHDVNAPEFARARERFYALWERVWSVRKAAGEEFVTATIEYGPPEWSDDGQYLGLFLFCFVCVCVLRIFMFLRARALSLWLSLSLAFSLHLCLAGALSPPNPPSPSPLPSPLSRYPVARECAA